MHHRVEKSFQYCKNAHLVAISFVLLILFSIFLSRFVVRESLVLNIFIVDDEESIKNKIYLLEVHWTSGSEQLARHFDFCCPRHLVATLIRHLKRCSICKKIRENCLPFYHENPTSVVKTKELLETLFLTARSRRPNF